MYFTDRKEAAIQLAKLVSAHKGPQTLVLAIPRGGVPIGYVLANQLEAPIDLLMAKRIGFPGDPEYAIGAVCENETIIDENSGVSPEYIIQQRDKIKKELKYRYTILTGRQRALSVQRKKVILVDDGIATGRTMLAAVRAIRKQRPASLIIAVPVCSFEASTRLKPEVDELVSCYYPDPFVGVGRFYREFTQVTDQEVIGMLRSTSPSSPSPVIE
ncbi:MAG: phosphoribosyltransferase [Sphingomonadales bacterium]